MQKNAYAITNCNIIAIKIELQYSIAKKPLFAKNPSGMSLQIVLFVYFSIIPSYMCKNCVYTDDEFWYYNNTALCKQ